MVVIVLFLVLGALLYIYVAGREGVPQGDSLVGYVATEGGLPAIVGVLFLLGLVASTYSSAGSALTALTTSMTLDILDGRKKGDEGLGKLRRGTHTAIAVTMALIIVAFNAWSSAGVITLIFTMASYTYGPLLGMFLFGLLTRRTINERAVPIIAILSPLICYVVSTHSAAWFGGYTFSYEIIILNAALTMMGLYIFSKSPTHQ
jgi:Na+/proline symporter